MGEKLPVISGKELLQFYIKMGCELKRVKGSHHVIKSIL
jgi:predicted RNA binding protein YcfA (HicA-like mRNA interferase family)